MSSIEIVAEAGVAWRNLDEAKLMIEHAKAAKVDAVKFQVYSDEVIRQSPVYEDLKRIMLNKETSHILLEHGKAVNCEVFFSVMYPEAIDFLEELNAKRYKIREKDARILVSESGSASPVEPSPLIKRVMETNKPVYMSVERKPLDAYWRLHPRIIWLYCKPVYPARLEELELWKCSLNHGFSCHCPEIVAPVTAAAMIMSTKSTHDAKVIEVHVSNEPKADYIDGNVSFNFQELAEITKSIRAIERMNLERPF